MKIMELISGWGVNGAIITCLETIRLLQRRGHQITLVCRPNAWIGDQLESETSVEVIRSDMHRWPTDELKRIAEIAKRNDIDLLHTHMSRANFFGVLLRRIYGFPCVATANNRYLQLHWMFNDRVIAASEATKRFHNRFNLVPRKKIDVIHNFIHHERFTLDNAAFRSDIRSEFQIGDSEFVIGQTGDAIPRKGLLYAVRALPDILASFPDTRLMAIGRFDMDYKETVTQEADRLDVGDKLIWTGEQKDVAPFLKSIDLAILPTLEDNLPLSILEAMASGLAIVATNVGGIPECVAHGENGLLVKPAQPRALATAIKSLMTDQELMHRMGAIGRDRVINEFSPESQGPRIESVFHRLAG